jgi:hypothetical protein
LVVPVTTPEVVLLKSDGLQTLLEAGGPEYRSRLGM